MKVAVASTWHTLTRLLMRIIAITRDIVPDGRLLQPWETAQVFVCFCNVFLGCLLCLFVVCVCMCMFVYIDVFLYGC